MHGIQDGRESEEALQRFLAEEEAERDGTRFALHRLYSAVDFYCQRLMTLRPTLKPGETTAVSRAKELVKDMEKEVATSRRNQGSTGPLAGSKSNYEVLSQSLKETQRQCESLNQEMVQQADGNERLVESMGSVKAANKGLLEQIRSQQNDVAQLTQQCVSCEEQAEQLRRHHEMERERFRQDAQHQAAILREHWAERSCEVQNKLRAQLRSVELKAVSLQSSATELRGDLEARRSDAIALSAEVAAWLSSWQQDIPLQLLEPFQKQRQAKTAVEKSISELRAKLSQEREERRQESLLSGRKYEELQTDKEDLQARIVRESSQLESRLQALEKRQLEERQSWVEERMRMEQLCGGQLQQLELCQGNLTKTDRDLAIAETAVNSKLSEVSSLEKVVAELQRQFREVKDALAAAVSSNDHLREQLHEQQMRFQDKSKDSLECQAPFTERLSENQRIAEAELALTAKQIEAMDAELQECDQELVRLLNVQEASLAELTRLDSGVSLWRSQCDTENSNREVLENEMNAAKHHFNGEHLILQTNCHLSLADIEDLEQEIRELTDDVVQKRRLLVSREGESNTRQAAAEAHLKESQDLLASCQNRLREAADHRARAKSEAEGQRRKSLEVMSVLERNLERQVQGLFSMRERYGAVLENESKVHEQAKQECDWETELAASVARQARSESRVRVEGMERERLRIEESRRGEVAQGLEYVAKLQQLKDDLQNDLETVRGRMMKSESRLNLVRQECFQEEREGMRMQRELDEVYSLRTLGPRDVPGNFTKWAQALSSPGLQQSFDPAEATQSRPMTSEPVVSMPK